MEEPKSELWSGLLSGADALSPSWGGTTPAPYLEAAVPERLPIQDAKEIAERRGLRQVILLAWDGNRSHVVTYGGSIEDCDQAALGGEKMKKVMGWPNWESEPSRVKKLIAALQRLVSAARNSRGDELYSACDSAEKLLASRGR